MSLTDGLSVLPVCLFLLLHLTNDVFTINECLKSTHYTQRYIQYIHLLYMYNVHMYYQHMYSVWTYRQPCHPVGTHTWPQLASYCSSYKLVTRPPVHREILYI